MACSPLAVCGTQLWTPLKNERQRDQCFVAPVGVEGLRSGSVLDRCQVYRDGDGVDVDKIKAVRFLEMAVNQGNADAMIRLVDMLLGVDDHLLDCDLERGMRLMEHVAHGGHAYAQYCMGEILWGGFHDQQEDQVAALQW